MLRLSYKALGLRGSLLCITRPSQDGSGTEFQVFITELGDR